jgi:transposase
MGKVFYGIDFHKNKTVICAVYQDGSDVHAIKTIKSSRIFEYFSNKTNCALAIEASGGTNHVVSKLRAAGLEVKLVNSNVFRGIGIGGKKTDHRDARALANYLRLGGVSEVHVRSVYAREIKSLIVNREMILRSRVNMTNHIRGTLKEFGLLIPVGKENFFREVGQKITKIENGYIRSSLDEMLEIVRKLVAQQTNIEERLKDIAQKDERIKKLKTIPGVGDMVSLMVVSVVDDISRFKNSREFSSYLGLVPKVNASAEKRMMGSITRSGSEILRRYLIHGARAWMRYDANGDDNRAWAEAVKERRGVNKATVALAHRMARIIFAVLRDDDIYWGKKKKQAPKMAA